MGVLKSPFLILLIETLPGTSTSIFLPAAPSFCFDFFNGSQISTFKFKPLYLIELTVSLICNYSALASAPPSIVQFVTCLINWVEQFFIVQDCPVHSNRFNIPVTCPLNTYSTPSRHCDKWKMPRHPLLSLYNWELLLAPYASYFSSTMDWTIYKCHLHNSRTSYIGHLIWFNYIFFPSGSSHV